MEVFAEERAWLTSFLSFCNVHKVKNIIISLFVEWEDVKPLGGEVEISSCVLIDYHKGKGSSNHFLSPMCN